MDKYQDAISLLNELLSEKDKEKEIELLKDIIEEIEGR